MKNNITATSPSDFIVDEETEAARVLTDNQSM